MAKKSGYKASIEELELIFENLRDGNIDVDDLEFNLKKALEHIKVCKEVLKKQESKVADILKEIEEVDN